MVAAATPGADTAALAVAAAALIAVLASVWWRAAATIAVLLATATVLLGEPAPMYTALAGLSAAGYLVLRHNDGRAPAPALLAAVGFAAAAALVVVIPLHVPWLPLAAPLAAFGAVVLALSPLLRDGSPPG
ncbi:hypothetical protein CRI77_00320 [Mycolicibacterium duvalii]|nr:hypothetical protein CRI77_00320 [Mycolicibacterium duvalii]